MCFPDTFSVLPSSEGEERVPFITPCAFDQPVKGGSKVEKTKQTEQMQLMKQMPGSGTSRGSPWSQVSALLFSHLPLGHSGGCLPADAFTRLMGGVGEGPGTSPGITIH